MSSQINPNNIDGTYPIAGVPNNTQGFRDNFTNIKTNFQYAEGEIDDLQNKVVLKSALTGQTLDNNMNDNLLYAVQLSDVSYKEVVQVATAGTITLDYSAGMYQAVPNVTGNLSLAFANWPAAGSVGKLSFAIVVANVGYTLTLPIAVKVGITTVDGLSPGTPGVSNVITFASAGTYIYEFETADGGNTISINNTIRPSNTYSNVIDITNTTPSTSTSTGALIVAGGVGLGANLNVAGDFTTYNTSNVKVFSVDSTTGYVHVNTGNIPANAEGALNIVGTGDGTHQPVQFAGGMLHLTSNPGQPSRLTSDAFGVNGGNGVYAQFTGRAGRGTAATPAALQSGDSMLRLTGVGWGTSQFPATPAPTSIDFVATENYTNTAYGSKVMIYTAPDGTATKTLSANITSTLTTVPALTATGNITGGNVITAGLMSTTGNVSAGNISTAGVIGATGNITTSGNILVIGNGALGYNTGAGGTVAQSGNKTQGVTLDKASGEITMQNTALAAATTVSFTLTNSTINTHDLLVINIVGGVATPATYNLDTRCNTGSALISIRNITTGSLSESVVLRYALIRGSVD